MPSAIARYAAELLALAPDVILANGTPEMMALQQVTRNVPIVFANVADPGGLGFVAILSRPGGTVTGLKKQVNRRLNGFSQEASQGRASRFIFFDVWLPRSARAPASARAHRPAPDAVYIPTPFRCGSSLAPAESEQVCALCREAFRRRTI
jgi:hypothetical protein